MSDKILSLGDKCYSLITVDKNFQLFLIPERYLVPFTPSKILRGTAAPQEYIRNMGSLFCLKNIACHFLLLY